MGLQRENMRALVFFDYEIALDFGGDLQLIFFTGYHRQDACFDLRRQREYSLRNLRQLFGRNVKELIGGVFGEIDFERLSCAGQREQRGEKEKIFFHYVLLDGFKTSWHPFVGARLASPKTSREPDV